MSQSYGAEDLARVMGGLKDFQRATVDYVFRRLYLDRDRTRRFLVADEVGLGKTLVARGLIARTIDHLTHQGIRRIDVVYICSNADIARQNIARLNVSQCREFELATRVTLLPTQMHALHDQPLNFISFTPGTSFGQQSSLGVAEERALLYALLDRAWGVRGAGPLNVLQGNMGKDNFRGFARDYRRRLQEDAIDASLATAFIATLAHHPELRVRFDDLCRRFGRARTRIPWQDRDDRGRFVGDLRTLLAAACLRALEPDLIILDEFQRFKHLLDPTDAAGSLARELFDYSDAHSAARVVLLSATPYKMYTMTDEAGGEDHYQDFLDTLKFLQNDEDATGQFGQLLGNYRRELFRLGQGSGEPMKAVRDDLEARLRKVMVRTERLAVSGNRDGMLTERPCQGLRLDSDDVAAYVSTQALARTLRMPDAMEYWKSAPYLLSFMDDYQFKHKFMAARQTAQNEEVAGVLATGVGLVLPMDQVRAYEAIDPGNARLRSLTADMLDSGAWQYLWMPPSLPYYDLAGAYANPQAARFTKRLVFSAWRMVPKVIATMMSYEAERRMLRAHEESPENTTEARRRRRPLLRFNRSDGRLGGMPVLGMCYPSIVLAREGDPLAHAQAASPERLGRDSLLTRVSARLADLLAPLVESCVGRDGEDEAWYWAAPLLLDLHHSSEEARTWLNRDDLAVRWAGSTDGEGEDETSGWRDHVNEARKRAQAAMSGERPLGQPPRDLVQVLALMAVGGPAVVALRALTRVAGGQALVANPEVRDQAGRVGLAFRTLFNQLEVMAMLRALDGQDRYWQRTLEYMVNGGVQAVLDEYAHGLRDALGLAGHPAHRIAEGLADAMRDALGLRASSMDVDDIRVGADGRLAEPRSQGMRGRFALRLSDDRAAEGPKTLRTTKVREAFNSPFWPFILATTSVGQEGLDFHPYCHAVVHWNLPANPVDLEQREGRVHRYKGHAVRKNLAQRYGVPPAHIGAHDPWDTLFAAAVCDRDPEACDLVPYWIYPIAGGASIERYVPALPLSRDLQRLDALRRALAIYRMVFGQSRQDDLVAYLAARLPADEVARIAAELRIDLSPPQV